MPSDIFTTNRFLHNLSLLYFTLLLATAVMGFKLVSLGPLFSAPSSGMIFTFTFFLGSIITEIYGYAIMRRLIWFSIIYGAIFVALISFFSVLPSPAYWNSGVEYADVFFHVIHFSVAGGLGFLISAFINAYIIAKTKVTYHGRYFWLRSFIAAAISELLADSISIFIAFFGALSAKQIFLIFGSGYIYKLGYSILAAAIANLMVYGLKKANQAGVSEHKTNFNPFIMKKH